MLKSEFETVFNTDLSDVRIHTGGYADEVAKGANAYAVTMGRDIYFRDGFFSPSSEAGKGLLAHELRHVIQHQEGARFVYLEDIESAEYSGESAETAVAGVNLHSVRPGDPRPSGQADTSSQNDPSEPFADGMAGAGMGGRESQSLSDFSSAGGSYDIQYRTREGEIIHMSKADWERAIDLGLRWVKDTLREESMLGDEKAYHEKYIKMLKVLGGGV